MYITTKNGLYVGGKFKKPSIRKKLRQKNSLMRTKNYKSTSETDYKTALASRKNEIKFALKNMPRGRRIQMIKDIRTFKADYKNKIGFNNIVKQVKKFEKAKKTKESTLNIHKIISQKEGESYNNFTKRRNEIKAARNAKKNTKRAFNKQQRILAKIKSGKTTTKPQSRFKQMLTGKLSLNVNGASAAGTAFAQAKSQYITAKNKKAALKRQVKTNEEDKAIEALKKINVEKAQKAPGPRAELGQGVQGQDLSRQIPKIGAPGAPEAVPRPGALRPGEPGEVPRPVVASPGHSVVSSPVKQTIIEPKENLVANKFIKETETEIQTMANKRLKLAELHGSRMAYEKSLAQANSQNKLSKKHTNSITAREAKYNEANSQSLKKFIAKMALGNQEASEANITKFTQAQQTAKNARTQARIKGDVKRTYEIAMKKFTQERNRIIEQAPKYHPEQNLKKRTKAIEQYEYARRALVSARKKMTALSLTIPDQEPGPVYKLARELNQNGTLVEAAVQPSVTTQSIYKPDYKGAAPTAALIKTVHTTKAPAQQAFVEELQTSVRNPKLKNTKSTVAKEIQNLRTAAAATATAATAATTVPAAAAVSIIRRTFPPK